MFAIERGLVRIALLVVDVPSLNAVLNDPRTVATLIGSLIAVAGGVLGTILLLRGMALTSDAISHTVLLGIVVTVLVMSNWFGMEPDLSSPWLIGGAAVAGVGTVLLTELIYRSGLVRQDAALGLVFPLLFAVSIIFVSRYVDDVHLDEDAVMVGEIGVAWANTRAHCFGECEQVEITPEDPRAETIRRCTNCAALGITPRDPGAEFETICDNCGTYSPSRAFRAGFIDRPPVVVFWPASLTTTLLAALVSTLWVTLFFKEIKLATFDPSLAHALGLRPTLINYGTMVLVSLVAVVAFDAVGSILVIAFFIIPPAAAYLLTSRLAPMLALSGVVGATAAFAGYDVARGRLPLVGQVAPGWNSSISASMVVTMLAIFVVVLTVSPRHGMVATAVRRRIRSVRFAEQIVLGHIRHHHGRRDAARELDPARLATHIRWNERRTRRVLGRLRRAGLVTVEKGLLELTDRGTERVRRFRG